MSPDDFAKLSIDQLTNQLSYSMLLDEYVNQLVSVTSSPLYAHMRKLSTLRGLGCVPFFMNFWKASLQANKTLIEHVLLRRSFRSDSQRTNGCYALSIVLTTPEHDKLVNKTQSSYLIFVNCQQCCTFCPVLQELQELNGFAAAIKF